MNKTLLLYMHGFESSPASFKAIAAKDYFSSWSDIDVEVPQMPCSPAAAAEKLHTILAAYPSHDKWFMGSSLGGFFATYLVHRFGGKAVVINPAVNPHKLLTKYLGTRVHPYTNQEYTLTHEHMHQLVKLNVEQLTCPENIYLLTKTGDEVLDYRDGVEHYKECKMLVENGGDHSFHNFEEKLSDIASFLKA